METIQIFLPTDSHSSCKIMAGLTPSHSHKETCSVLRGVNLDHELFAGLQDPNQRLNSPLHQWVTSAKYFLRICFISHFLTCSSTFAQAAFLPKVETSWAVEAFVMAAAILEKDKVPHN